MDDFQTHAVVAFLTPLAWALIIYPMAKRFNKDWIIFLITALFLSFVVMIIKELGDDHISRNDIVADMVGLLFGTAAIASFFFSGNAAVNKEGRLLLRQRKNISSTPTPRIILKKRETSLREVMQAGMMLSNFGARYFSTAAPTLSDLDAKKLCLNLAQHEAGNVVRLSDTLNTWLPQPITPAMVEWTQLFIYKNDLYTRKFPLNASEKELLQYAVVCKGKIKRFYSHFRNSFPELWKKMHLDYLIQEESEYMQTLELVLKKLNNN